MGIKKYPGIQSIKQGPAGIATVTLHNQITITHEYTRRDRMEIHFEDDYTSYVIPNDKELKEIYNINMQNDNIIESLHRYCECNLSKC